MPYPPKGRKADGGAKIRERQLANAHKTNYSENWMCRAKPDHPRYDPALREKLLELVARTYKQAGAAKAGVPYGWTKEDWKYRRQFQMNRAQVMVDYMKKQGLIEAPEGSDKDAERSEAALVYAVSVVNESNMPVKDRLMAARLVLDFSKQKPAAKQDIKVSAAEDWLAGIADAAGI